LIPFFSIHAVLDLEKAQDFVLDAQQIKLPQHPYAFNPSIVRWNGLILMSFREVAYPTYHSWIGLVWLDDQFQPVNTPQYLNTGLKSCEDARLILIHNHLYIVYSSNEKSTVVSEKTSGGFRMHVAELIWDGQQFKMQKIQYFLNFEGERPHRKEKNWVPFEYQNELLLAYSLMPHRILRPIPDSDACETLYSTQNDIRWRWGELRGGTPGLIDSEHYLAFFHSSYKMLSPFSQGKKMPHYFIGAYTFAAQPPFQITSISPTPILGKNFYERNFYRPHWHPVIVIFPCGFIFDHEHIWLVYGKHDHELWMVKMDKQKLLKSLAPVHLLK